MAKNRHFARLARNPPAPGGVDPCRRRCRVCGHVALLAPAVRDAMPLDMNRLFPMQDLPSARLMKLKALCLFRAGILSQDEKAAIRQKADAMLENPRFHSAQHPRRAA
jgi:hypothetical protein